MLFALALERAASLSAKDLKHPLQIALVAPSIPLVQDTELKNIELGLWTLKLHEVVDFELGRRTRCPADSLTKSAHVLGANSAVYLGLGEVFCI